MKIINTSKRTMDSIKSLDNKYIEASEMIESERAFLTELVLTHKPKKLLELGVAAGASSLLMLNAIKDLKESKLYSVDYSTEYYRDKSKKTGWLVDLYPPPLKDKYTLFTNGFVYNHIEKIGNDIDFCLIDTVHLLPGEVLDFLLVLPYLKEDCVLVFHDVNLHTNLTLPHAGVNNMLLSAITGKKLLPETYNFVFSDENVTEQDYVFPNIAGVELNTTVQKENIWDIFNILLQHWKYTPTNEELLNIIALFENYYGKEYAHYFKKIAIHQQKVLNTRQGQLQAVVKIVSQSIA